MRAQTKSIIAGSWFLAFMVFVFSPWGRSIFKIPGVAFFFGRIIPFLMVPLPLICGLSKPTTPLEGAHAQHREERIRSLARQLWIGTAILLGLVILTQFWAQHLGSAWILPFFVLQYFVVLPLIREKSLNQAGLDFMPITRRSASLTPRQEKGAPPRWAWIAAWGIVAVAALPSLIIVSPHMTSTRGKDTLFGLCWACLSLAAAPFTIRWWIQQPEPMNPANSPALSKLYQRIRLIKAWGVFGLAVELAIAFSGLVALNALRIHHYDQVLLKLAMVAWPISIAFVIYLYKATRMKASRLLRELVGEADGEPNAP